MLFFVRMNTKALSYVPCFYLHASNHIFFPPAVTHSHHRTTTHHRRPGTFKRALKEDARIWHFVMYGHHAVWPVKASVGGMPGCTGVSLHPVTPKVSLYQRGGWWRRWRCHSGDEDSGDDSGVGGGDGANVKCTEFCSLKTFFGLCSPFLLLVVFIIRHSQEVNHSNHLQSYQSRNETQWFTAVSIATTIP